MSKWFTSLVEDFLITKDVGDTFTLDDLKEFCETGSIYPAMVLEARFSDYVEKVRSGVWRVTKKRLRKYYIKRRLK